MQEQSTVEKKPFKIETRAHVQWYARKLSQFDDEEAHLKENYEVLIDRVRKDRARFKSYFDEQVKEFILGVMAKSGLKTVSTLYGSVGISNIQPKIKIANTVSVVEYCRRFHPDFIKLEMRSVESMTKEGIDYFKELKPDPETGEVGPVRLIEGVEFVPGHLIIRHSHASRHVSMYDTEELTEEDFQYEPTDSEEVAE